MPTSRATGPVLTRADATTPLRIAESALCRDGHVLRLAEFHSWYAGFAERCYAHVRRVDLGSLAGWATDPHTGNIRHHSGKFFTVEGLEVHLPQGVIPRWSQPVIRQPEVGILGILAKEFGGVLHLLMQAKVEPGNHNGLQLSPTVQATRSNYTRVHQGRTVPYLEYFLDTSRHRVICDVRQSEQGSWFLQKRNRNMVVEVVGDVEVLDGFCWLTLGQVHQLFAVDDLVNMDARTVLSCLPFAGTGLSTAVGPPPADPFTRALVRSCSPDEGSLHSTDDLLSWITERRTRIDVHTWSAPLRGLRRWRHAGGMIFHDTGRYFNVIGVDVTAGGREVRRWSQPMFEPIGIGVVAVLVRVIGGVLHALLHARAEPGYVDVIELAPTVQCTPGNYDLLHTSARPRFLDCVLHAPPERVRYEAVLSEEGGRFYHARTRYLVIETDTDIGQGHPGYRWVALHQLAELLRHSHYVNIQARSLVACLHSLFGAAA